MPVYKRPNSPYWWYQITWQGQKFRGSTSQKTRRAAERVEDQRRRELADGVEAARQLTLDEAAQIYWSEVAEGQATAETTDYQLANINRLIGKGTLLSEIDDSLVTNFVQRRRGEKSRHGRRLSPATVNREIELLRRVMYRAHKTRKIPIGDVDFKAQRLIEPEGRHPTLTDKQEAGLLSELAEHLKVPFRFSLLTGLRARNVFDLDWSQVDIQGRRIVFRVKSRLPGGKVHVLPITDAMLVLLANQGPKDEGLVFTRQGEPIKSYKTAWKAALRRAGLPAGTRWHDLRHVAGSRMVQRGVDVSVVKEVLGHSDIGTTMRYVHHDTDAKRAALDALAGHTMDTQLTEAYSNSLKVKG